MNTRRKFLLQGSMATTALLVAKPFTTVANSLAPVTGYSINSNKLVLVHTGNHSTANNEDTLLHISNLRKTTGNLMVLHAGVASANHANPFKYDASIQPGEPFSVTEGDYKIIYKGDIKTGIINASASENISAEKIDALATYLKKEKNCQLVVCLSQLGYKTKNNLDDLRLAAASSHLDIIIGGHAENFCKQPLTVLNRNREEVIINHAAGNKLALRKIEIDFDEKGKKRQIAFTRSIPRSKNA